VPGSRVRDGWWWEALPALAVTVLFWASLFVYAPVLPGYVAARGAPLGTVGLVVGAYGISQFLLRIPLGIAADRWVSRRRVVLGGLVAAGLGALLLALGETPGVLVLGRALAGAGAACWVALLVVTVGAFPGARLTDALSVITVVATVAEAGAVLAGGALAEWLGWTAPFYAAALLAGLGLLPAASLAEARPDGRGRPSGADLRRAATRPRLLIVSATTALVTFTVYTTTYGFVPVFAPRLGATPLDVGILATLAQLGFTGGALLAGLAGRRAPAPALLVLGSAVVAGSAAAVPAVPGLLALHATQLAGGIGRGLVNTVAAALALADVPEAERATSMGVYQATWALGIVAGPPLAGWVASEQGLAAAFLTGAAASAAAAGLAGWLWALGGRGAGA
jgi:MFS family permease